MKKLSSNIVTIDTIFLFAFTLLVLSLALSSGIEAKKKAEVPVNHYGETAKQEKKRLKLEKKQKMISVEPVRKIHEQEKTCAKKIKKNRSLKTRKKELVKERNHVVSVYDDVIKIFENDHILSTITDVVVEEKKEYTTHMNKKIRSCGEKILSLKNEISVLKEKPDDIVFNPQDVTEPSNISVEEMKSILQGTGLEHLAKTYVECEKEYGVNAIFLCSLSAHESGWGTSRRARRDNNYTGFGVYSDDAVGINAKTPEGNIRMTANHLSENYLKEGSSYYMGTSIYAVNEHYCVGPHWGIRLTNIGYRLMAKLKNNQ